MMKFAVAQGGWQIDPTDVVKEKRMTTPHVLTKRFVLGCSWSKTLQRLRLLPVPVCMLLMATALSAGETTSLGVGQTPLGVGQTPLGVGGIPATTPAPTPLFQEDPKRMAVPDADAQAEARKRILEIYKDDMAGAKKPEEKVALARK
jgi:hypothetical protein